MIFLEDKRCDSSAETTSKTFSDHLHRKAEKSKRWTSEDFLRHAQRARVKDRSNDNLAQLCELGGIASTSGILAFLSPYSPHHQKTSGAYPRSSSLRLLTCLINFSQIY